MFPPIYTKKLDGPFGKTFTRSRKRKKTNPRAQDQKQEQIKATIKRILMEPVTGPDLVFTGNNTLKNKIH